MTDKKPNPGLQQFADKIGKAVAERKAAQGNSEVSGALPKPAKQELEETHITWIWDSLPGVSIEATYDKSTKEYNVELLLATDTAHTLTLNGDEAKSIAESLLSASQWEDVWQSHAGEFLA